MAGNDSHRGMEARLPRTPSRGVKGLWKGFVQGSVGAMVGSSFAHPLDLIKVRLQLQGQHGDTRPRTGIVGMGVRTVKEEGVTALFKGHLRTRACMR